MAGSVTLRWLAVILMAGGSLAAAEQMRTVRVDIDERGALVIPMVVGNASCRFLLDTGATTSIVTDRLARRLGLDPIGTSVVGSSSGADRTAPVVALPSVVLGGFARKSLRALVLPQATLDAAAPGVDGVLAQDFLTGLNYTLDYRRRRFTWDGPQDGGTDTRGRLALTRVDGRFVADIVLPGSTRPLHLVPDTGSDALVLFGDAPSVRLAPTTARVMVSGVTGSSMAAVMRLPALDVRGVVVRNLNVLTTAGRQPEGADGLLPLHVFDSVSFAGDGAYLVVR